MKGNTLMKFQILFILLTFSCSIVIAQDNPEGQSQDEELVKIAKLSQNPIANMYSLPFQDNITFGVGPDKKVSNTLNMQPVIPLSLGSKVILIVRTIIPLITSPYAKADNSSVTGLGDISMSLFFSPAQAGKWIWGIGPVIEFPTSTNSNLGYGEWNLGPSIIFLQMRGKWVYGLTANNVWSLGNNNVHKFFMQYFVNYNFGKGWFVSWQPIVTANWKASSGNKWLVPFGANVGKAVRIGNQAMTFQAGAYWNAIRPDNVGSWSARFFMSFMWPRKK